MPLIYWFCLSLCPCTTFLSLGRLCHQSPQTVPLSLLCAQSTQRRVMALTIGWVRRAPGYPLARSLPCIHTQLLFPFPCLFHCFPNASTPCLGADHPLHHWHLLSCSLVAIPLAMPVTSRLGVTGPEGSGLPSVTDQWCAAVPAPAGGGGAFVRSPQIHKFWMRHNCPHHRDSSNIPCVGGLNGNLNPTSVMATGGLKTLLSLWSNVARGQEGKQNTTRPYD